MFKIKEIFCIFSPINGLSIVAFALYWEIFSLCSFLVASSFSIWFCTVFFQGMQIMSFLQQFSWDFIEAIVYYYNINFIIIVVVSVSKELIKMQVFDLRWKTCFISKENLVVFYLVFHLVSRFIPLIQVVIIIYWLLIEWIIDEFENNKVKLGFVLVAQKFNLPHINCPYSKLLLFVFNL